jgi:hypothetical protein
MALNNLTNYWTALYYTVAGRTHVQKFQVEIDPTSSDVPYRVLRNDGVDVNWSSAIDTFILAIDGMYATTTSFDSAELWRQLDTEAVPVFLEGKALTAVGVSGTQRLGAQGTLSLRGADGSHGRLVFLEGNSEPHFKQTPALYGAAVDTVATYLLSDDSIYRTRTGAKVIATKSFGVCYNDKLTRVRFGVS